ncbi:hypothetical protein MNBD_CHLOROFLEXI01-5045 [hydrothermal vent metagenome]|uniref:Histidine kinase domain-containing protein n=1 Tax=hydrothermal vent metagenome TaxID=652676 RepID=A0A3B0VIJ1_9ZZZZ
MYIDFREARQFEDFEIETYQLFADNLTQTISLAKSLELNHRRANHLASLNKIGVALTSETILHREQIYEIIHEQVDKLLDADNYYMALYDQEQDVVSFAQVVVDGTSVPVGVSPYTPRKRGKGLTELIIETKEPMLARHGVGELYEKAGRKDYVGKLAKSWVGVPLLFQDNVMGVIALYDWKKEMVYDDQDKEFLQTIGTQAATALQIRKNFLNLEAEFKRTESANKRLKTAREISQAVVTDLGVDHILQVLRDHFKCDYAIILNLDPETDELYIFSQSGVGDVLDKTPRIPLGQGVSGQAAQQNRTIRLNDVQKHQKGTYVKYIADVKSEMATPLRDVSGKVIGVLDLEHVERDAFDLEDELLIELVAEEIVLALRNIEHIEELKLREEKERFSYLGILAAGIAHKIGGSVGLIGFEINDIRRLSNNASPELEEVLQRFEVEKKYLHELSEALLKPEQAKKATIEPIEIHKVLDDAIEVAQNRLDELDVPPTLTGIESLPPVNGNKFLVEVFAELIRNSVKAMKESPQKILQINGRTTTANNFVEIHFIDTGHGISVEQIDHIFELFFTLSSVGGEGGYGLWMIKSIVTGFGGNIYAESEGEDKGSRFIICLPIT